MYGQALQEIAELENRTLGVVKGRTGAPSLDAAGRRRSLVGDLNYFALIFCLMVGTASLPHILMRYFTTPNVQQARQSVGWSLFFIFLLYFTAPAYAAFAKLEVYSNVIGQPIASCRPGCRTGASSGRRGMLDAIIRDACNNGDGILQLAEFTHPPGHRSSWQRRRSPACLT